MLAEYGDPRDHWYLDQSAGDDFVGVQAYTRTFIGPEGPRPVSPDVETTLTGWEFFPEALELGVRSAWERSGGVPVLVTENGIATADDTRRIAYTQGALEGTASRDLGRHRRAGVPALERARQLRVGQRLRPTFGLIGFDHHRRSSALRASLAWLGEVARRNAL